MQIKNIVLGIAIMILTIFVMVYGIRIIFTPIEYNDYCEGVKPQVLINTQVQCEAVGGQWHVYEGVKSEDGVIEGYCDRYYTCQEEYGDARELRSKNVFYLAIPLGIVLIFIGGYLFGLEAVGAGLMGGGVGTIVYGAGVYWEYSGDAIKFVISLIGLIAVIYLSYWLNKRVGKKK